MLNNCIQIFEKQPNMEKLVLDTYVPADGDYIVMKYENGEFTQEQHLQVKQDKKTRALNITPIEKSHIAKLDYYSKLLEMNKPVDPKKVIHSNNYLSFWIKKENLNSGKLTDEVIDKYYEILKNPLSKYTKPKDKELYESVEKELGKVNVEYVETVKTWIKKNIHSLPFPVEGKDYLKLFFVFEDIEIEAEGKRYFIPNLFNKNDYNEKIGDEIYGVPNNNMQMNSKKPFLEYKNRKKKVALLQTSEEVMIKKFFFDYLMNCVSEGKYNIYFIKEKEEQDEYKIKSWNNKDLPEISNGYGYYLRAAKDKNEARIEEMDCITNYRARLFPPVTIKNCTDITTEKEKDPIYGSYRRLKDVARIINNVLFSKTLANNYFTEPSELSGVEPKIKRFLILYRNAFFEWFYKGSNQSVQQIWDKMTMDIIKATIENGYFLKVNQQFNLRISFIDYFKGGNISMADVMIEIRNELRNKINSKEYTSIQNENEYYYAVGQLASFLLSKNKSKKRDHSLINSFLNVKGDGILKNKLVVLFKKYNYDIEAYSKRFNNLYNMVLSYQPECVMKQDYLIAGYISSNLIYEKEE